MSSAIPATPTPGTTYSYEPQYAPLPLSSASVSFPFENGDPKPWRQEEKGEVPAITDVPEDSKRPRLLDPRRWSFSSAKRPTELRRFSFGWWKYYVRLQFGRKRFPRFLYAVCGIVLLGVWLSITSSFATSLLTNEANNRVVNVNSGDPTSMQGLNQPAALLFMSGQIGSFDSTTRTLNVGWSALIVQGPITDLSTIADHQVSVDNYGIAPIAIFRDTVARKDTELIAANGTVNGLVPFRLRAPSIKPIGYLGISDYDQINTDIGLGQQSSSITLQPEFGYPFDVFSGNITFVAANNITIEQSGRLGSGVVAMNGALLTDSILNFKIRTSVYTSCLDRNSPGCELTVTFWVERTGLVKFCVFVVFFINWIITISIFIITGEALLLHRQNILEGTDILAICFTALFALPSVRSLLPGVPSQYGCLLDLLGILPNVIIVTLCTTFFTNSRLRMRARKAAEEAALAAEETKSA